MRVPQKNIVLIGFMGTGKTAVGKRLAAKLKLNFLDTDTLVEDSTGTAIPEIFQKYGEKYFRDQESLAVEKAARTHNCVIATGGGVVLNPENIRKLQENGYVILLEARPDVIARRVRASSGRPLLNKDGDLTARITELLQERAPYYRDYELRIDTSDLTVEHVIERIIVFLQEQGAIVERGCDGGDP